MRLRLSLALLVILLVPPASAMASGRDVLRDCADDEVLSKTYTQKEYRDALSQLATDSSEYSDCESVIRRAQLEQAAGRDKKSSGGGGATTTPGGGATGGGGSTGSSGAAAPTDSTPTPAPAARGTDPLRRAEPGGARRARRGAHRRRAGHPGVGTGCRAAGLLAGTQPHRLERPPGPRHRIAHPPRRRTGHRDRRSCAHPCPGSPNGLARRSCRQARAGPSSSRRPSRRRATPASTSRSRCCWRRRSASSRPWPVAGRAWARRPRPRSGSSSPPVPWSPRR